jgi:hypothetical protein
MNHRDSRESKQSVLTVFAVIAYLNRGSGKRRSILHGYRLPQINAIPQRCGGSDGWLVTQGQCFSSGTSCAIAVRQGERAIQEHTYNASIEE